VSFKCRDHCLAAEVQQAIVDVLVAKAIDALKQTGHQQLVVAGGVSANKQLRERLNLAAKANNGSVFFPPQALCTDNGAMIALAGAMRLAGKTDTDNDSSANFAQPFSVRPRWPLNELNSPETGLI